MTEAAEGNEERVELVRKRRGRKWFVRLVAANNETRFVSEPYERREGAEESARWAAERLGVGLRVVDGEES